MIARCLTFLVLVGGLSACGVKVEADVRSRPAPVETAASSPVIHLVPVETARGAKYTMQVREVCIDRTIYLVNENGNLTPKMYGDPNSDKITKAYTQNCK